MTDVTSLTFRKNQTLKPGPTKTRRLEKPSKKQSNDLTNLSGLANRGNSSALNSSLGLSCHRNEIQKRRINRYGAGTKTMKKGKVRSQDPLHPNDTMDSHKKKKKKETKRKRLDSWVKEGQ